MSGKDLKNIKALVIEDDEASQRLVTKYLNIIGITHIVAVQNGEEALQKLYLNTVNIIITDWCMPEMNGLDFFKEAKRQNLIEGIPVLMISAENEKEKVIEALKGGIRDYMVKPLELEPFKAKVSKLLKLE
ncbi:MAG: response regulator [Candidatus Nitrohelix vancouverensis]|uniref:Response regulator n=1 Tax=Candidatus Nitrohelix vancouverensis TaxID=2705534 RepID=A0A7T0G2P0_9BACT|nr:MAG: response regulator [Candidatus Nitrohelix vancouverensis]